MLCPVSSLVVYRIVCHSACDQCIGVARRTEVCGAPPQQLVWWKSAPVGGPTTLPPLQEYVALQVVFDYLMDIADDVPDDGETPDLNKAHKLPKAKKGSAFQEPSPAVAEKKKRKKKKDKANETAKANVNGGAKPSECGEYCVGNNGKWRVRFVISPRCLVVI